MRHAIVAVITALALVVTASPAATAQAIVPPTATATRTGPEVVRVESAGQPRSTWRLTMDGQQAGPAWVQEADGQTSTLRPVPKAGARGCVQWRPAGDFSATGWETVSCQYVPSFSVLLAQAIVGRRR